jgi:hypothetical protein
MQTDLLLEPLHEIHYLRRYFGFFLFVIATTFLALIPPDSPELGLLISSSSVGEVVGEKKEQEPARPRPCAGGSLASCWRFARGVVCGVGSVVPPLRVFAA